MEVENRTSQVVRWERFLPQMVLRVLVVEPDNSTRHVISALLRKCSYKVTSVSDGLEAWEALKEKRKSIDLILTEVELPSISGFTLLTLVMDHDVCKKIPVIMMSSQDSISTVLKCMLKGAADFLIKPIRKNELKKSLAAYLEESTAENKSLHAEEEHRKIGATSEKTAASSPSNDYILSEQEDVVCKDTKIISKDFSQMECEDTMDWSKANTNLDEECVKIDIDSGLHGSKIEFNRRDNSLLESPSLAAIDMIGSFGSGKRKFEISNFTVGISSSTCGPHLGLSLQGSNPSGPRSSEADEGRLLNHSSASAFSRYNSGNRFRLSLPSSSMVNSKAQGTVSSVNELKQVHQSYLRMAFSNNGDNCTTVIKEQSEKVENASASSLVLVQIQGSSTNLNEGYRRPSPTPLYAQACQALAWSTHLTGKPDQSVIQLSNSGSSKLQKGACADNMNAKSSSDIHERENKSQKGDCIGSVAFRPCSSNHSSINISSMCAENVEEGNEHIRNVKLDNDSGIGGSTIPGIKCSGPNRMDTILSSEREAALMKFRQKRSKRCFEKKVRYESRRQLAEQRPRVKGQFARQIQTDSAASGS